MNGIAPSVKDAATDTLEGRLWEAAARVLETTLAGNVAEILET